MCIQGRAIWRRQKGHVQPLCCHRAGSHCVADNGAKLDASLESREAEGVRGLLRPQSWGLKLTSPAAAGLAAIPKTS